MSRCHLGILLSVVILGGCGATASPAPPALQTGTPTAEPTLAPTPAPTPAPTREPTPSPTPALKTIEDLIAAKHPVAKPAAVTVALNAAFEANPAGAARDPYWKNGWRECHTSDPTNPMERWSRENDCFLTISRLMADYRVTGDPAFFDAALLVYNYAIHAKGLEVDTNPGTTSGSLKPFQPTLNEWLRQGHS